MLSAALLLLHVYRSLPMVFSVSCLEPPAGLTASQMLLCGAFLCRCKVCNWSATKHWCVLVCGCGSPTGHYPPVSPPTRSLWQAYPDPWSFSGHKQCRLCGFPFKPGQRGKVQGVSALVQRPGNVTPFLHRRLARGPVALAAHICRSAKQLRGNALIMSPRTPRRAFRMPQSLFTQPLTVFSVRLKYGARSKAA